MERCATIIGTFPPPSGGQSIHIKMLGEYLDACGWRIDYFNTGPDKDYPRPFNVQQIRGFPAFCLATWKSSASIFHIHTSDISNLKRICAFVALCVMKGKKGLITFHSGRLIGQLERRGGMRKGFLKTILNRLPAIICVNAEMARAFRTLGIEEGRLKVLPAFSLHCSDETLDLEEMVAEFVKAHQPLLLSMGTGERQYGLELSINALANIMVRYPNAGLVILGPGERGEDLRHHAATLGITQSVKILGNVSHEVCLSILKRSDLYLRPTYYDGDAISVREALALSVPVIASDAGFRPDGVITFPVGDIERMVESVLAVLVSGKDSNRVGKPVSEQGNLEAIRMLYEDLLKETRLICGSL